MALFSVPSMKSIPRLLLALSFFWPCIARVDAAPPASVFTYQGRINDGAAPASGSYDFRFVLYDAALNGNQVGPTVAAENLTVVDGVFAATLDFGTVFDGSARWIEVAVRPGAGAHDFTVLTPRQPLSEFHARASTVYSRSLHVPPCHAPSRM